MRVFTEIQRMDQWWFRLIIIVSLIIIIGSVIMAFPDMKQDTTLSGIILTISISIGILLIVIGFFIKLETKIDDQGIHHKFWPINLRTKLISWYDIKECYVRHYSPIKEYGGWGYHGLSLRNYGKALNIKDKTGIQILLKNDKKLLIGTQKEEEAKKVLEKYHHKFTST